MLKINSDLNSIESFADSPLFGERGNTRLLLLRRDVDVNDGSVPALP
jgi:hypothetical protein